MEHILKNEQLTVVLDTHGAEMRSVKRGDCEYVWQGDPTYWGGRAPLLFPICGRFFEQTYTYRGNKYTQGTHGFARHSEFTLVSGNDTEATFLLEANDEIRANYPFDFALLVTYRLDGATLTTTATIKNTGDEVLPATFGGHPGFNVPLDKGEFTDYYLEFAEECSPDEILMSETCFITGKRRGYPLKNGKILPLRHSLFDIDGVFIARMADSVTLKSDKGERSVTLKYSDMPYLGMWHAPRTEAPYICIEPWCGLPAYDNTIEDISEKPDMFRIEPASEKTVGFSVSFN
jgi:galactose mutarotase-like enzyme